MLQTAIKAAGKSPHKYRHGVALTRGGSVVATGFNSGITHAEDQALNKLWPSERVGLCLYSVRVTHEGRLAMAKPCAKCQDLLRAAGIRKVYFSNEFGEIERMRL